MLGSAILTREKSHRLKTLSCQYSFELIGIVALSAALAMPLYATWNSAFPPHYSIYM
jgi:hypothetical protein